jgi:threonine dehydrogenase-like Zn-dependent dehydrogenase
MWETVLYEPGDVHCDKLPEPKLNPTGATIRLSASCNCGTDLWPFLHRHPIRRQDRIIEAWIWQGRSDVAPHRRFVG